MKKKKRRNIGSAGPQLEKRRGESGRSGEGRRLKVNINEMK